MQTKSSIKEDYFSYKDYKIFYFVRTPSTRTKTTIVLLHGRQTHSGYWNLLFGSDSNYNLIAFDYPSQGKSSGPRGHIDAYKELPAILAYFISNIVIKHKTDNIYLLGESLGALLAFYTIHEYRLPIKITGLIFVPGVYSVTQLKKKRALAALYLLSRLLPRCGLTNKKPFSFYTNDQQILDIMNADSYYCRFSSFRYLYSVYRLVKYQNRKINDLAVPILIFHGKSDHYTDMQDMRSFFQRIPNNINKKLIILEHSKHWLIVGSELPKIKSAIDDWIKKISID